MGNGLTATRGSLALNGGSGPTFVYTKDVYINKTGRGGGWSSLAEGTLSIDFIASASESRPGIGFASRDGK